MHEATRMALTALRRNGYRITDARKEVIGVLGAQEQPLTIREMAERMDVDEATAYRTIELLRAEGLVEEITVPKERSRFSLTHGHHHHIRCESCGLVAHVPCGPIEEPRKLPKDFVEVYGHEVTFKGLCKRCV